jgi:hypothetical protein
VTRQDAIIPALLGAVFAAALLAKMGLNVRLYRTVST